MVFPLVLTLVGILLGAWAWNDRRYYGYGIVQSALWALGIGAGVPIGSYIAVHMISRLLG